MAIINTYPTATPKGADLLIGTQVKDDTVLENSTKSFSVDALGSYIVTSTSGITGSGTLNTIAMFTPSGQAIGDSVMFKIPNNPWIQVGVVGSGQETVLGPGFVSTTALGANNIQAADGGSVTLLGNVVIGNADTDQFQVNSTSEFNAGVVFDIPGYVEFRSAVKDHLGNLPSSNGQILVGDTSGSVTWTDSTDIVSGAVAKLIPFQVTASAGGSSTYSANNNIVEIGWTGGNGIYVINLPSATAIPYRVIRFVTNGTYPAGGAHKARVTATGGETINGNAFFEITKDYTGMTIWSTGTEWISIQVKAH